MLTDKENRRILQVTKNNKIILLNYLYEDYFEKQQLELFDDASQHGFRIYKVDD